MNGFEQQDSAGDFARRAVFLLTVSSRGATEQAAFDVGICAVFSKYQGLDPIITRARAVLRPTSNV